LLLLDNFNSIESLGFEQKQDIKITPVGAVERGTSLALEESFHLRRQNAFNDEPVVYQFPCDIHSIDIKWVSRTQLIFSFSTSAARRLREQRGLHGSGEKQ
jgi:hypothetical protein